MTRSPLLSSILAFLFSSLFSFAAEAVEGVWEETDGQSQVRFKIENGKLNGYLVKIADKSRVQDSHNPDIALRDRNLLGLQIFRGFRKQGAKWVAGTLDNPSKGKTYKGKIRLDGRDTLKIRKYMGVPMIGRSTDWKRVQ